MNYLHKAKMDGEALELVLKYPEMMDKFNNDYRVDLFRLYATRLDTEVMNKTQEAAALYNASKDFKLSQSLKVIMEILQVKLSTINRRLHMAREAGLVIKISAEKFGGK